MDTQGHAPSSLSKIASLRPLGLFCDLDGTIAPIVSTPQAARVSPTAIHLLKSLAKRLDLLALVSGRSLARARQMVPLRGAIYVGNHGLEFWEGGNTRLAPGAAPWRRFMARAVRELQAAGFPKGIVLEPKGIALSIHYRLFPDPERARSLIIEALGRLPLASRAAITEGRKVVDLRPNLPVHKGTAVEALAQEHSLRGAIYMGDDATDLDAFRALMRLEKEGKLKAVTVAIRSAESPPELLDRAQYVLEGTRGALIFLRNLETALGGLV